MSKREIIRDQWVTFFEVFTSDHSDQRVSINVGGHQPKAHAMEVEARELPFREISADIKDKENTVVISVGLSIDKLLRHVIPSVLHVYAIQTEGVESVLEIESMNGQTTTLSLLAA